MWESADFGTILQHSANIVVVAGGLYALWRFLKRFWRHNNE